MHSGPGASWYTFGDFSISVWGEGWHSLEFLLYYVWGFLIVFWGFWVLFLVHFGFFLPYFEGLFGTVFLEGCPCLGVAVCRVFLVHIWASYM